MKDEKWMLAVIGLSMMTGCIRVGSAEEDAERTLRPLAETAAVEELSSVAEAEVVRIPLEETNAIAPVMKGVVDESGGLYVLDMLRNLVRIDPAAASCGRVLRKGRAANEYLDLADLAVCDGKLLVLDGAKIKFFDMQDPKQVHEMTVPGNIPVDAIAPDGAGGVYLYGAFPAKAQDIEKTKDFLLRRMNAEGEVVSEAIPREDCTFSIMNITQTSGNRYYLRPQNNRHVFYRLTADGPQAAYRIDFGEETIPARYYFEQAGEDMGAYFMSKYYKLPIGLQETANHLYFYAAGPEGREHHFLYDKRSGKGIRWEASGADAPMPIVAADEDCFYIVLSEFDAGQAASFSGALTRFVGARVAREADGEENLYLVKLRFGRF